jgi:hypothetical protein
MRTLIAALIVLIGMGSAGSVRASFYTGNEVHDWCKSDNPRCLIYSIGILDAQNFLNTVKALNGGELKICAPKNANAGQVKDIVKAYLENNPAVRNQSAPGLVMLALNLAWPCKK